MVFFKVAKDDRSEDEESSDEAKQVAGVDKGQ